MKVRPEMGAGRQIKGVQGANTEGTEEEVEKVGGRW